MIRIALAGLVALWSCVALAHDAFPDEDVRAIEKAINNWDTAWKTKDARLAAQNYSDDADWTNAFGMARRGRSEIEKLITEVFALPFVMAGKSATVEQTIRKLDSNMALVISRVEREGQQSPSGETMSKRQTTHHRLFRKTKDGWQIIAHLISDARDTERTKH